MKEHVRTYVLHSVHTAWTKKRDEPFQQDNVVGMGALQSQQVAGRRDGEVALVHVVAEEDDPVANGRRAHDLHPVLEVAQMAMDVADEGG